MTQLHKTNKYLQPADCSWPFTKAETQG